MSEHKFEDQFSPFGEFQVEPLSNFQNIVARRLSKSWTQIPQVTHHDDIDVTKLEAYRKSLPYKITPLAFVTKALALSLKVFPRFNASLSDDGKNLVLKNYYNIGIAVDGPLGLLVPVIRDVADKTTTAIAAEIAEMSEKARTKGLPMSDMSGGCMTISSLGALGGTAFTPIINQPEVAILGITRTKVKASWNGSEFEPRPMMPVSLTYDHRVINGADAARLVSHLADLLDAPEQL